MDGEGMGKPADFLWIVDQFGFLFDDAFDVLVNENQQRVSNGQWTPSGCFEMDAKTQGIVVSF